jgi:hypothetical protein
MMREYERLSSDVTVVMFFVVLKKKAFSFSFIKIISTNQFDP